MREFLIYWRDLADPIDATIPAAKELIKNESPYSDGFFKVDVETNSKYGISVSGSVLIDVYGAPPTIKMIRIEDGRLEIVWEDSLLQTSPTIDGPREDVAFGGGTLRWRMFPSALSKFFSFEEAMIPTARIAKRTNSAVSRGSALTGRPTKFSLEKLADANLKAMESNLRRAFALGKP